MADNHRNYRGGYNTSNQDWNENRNRQGNQRENQGYSNFQNRYQDEHNDSGSDWNQQDRSSFNQGNHGFGHHDRDYNYGSFNDDDRNYGYGGREYGSNYGGGGYQGNSSYYNSGSMGSSGKPSYGNSRNLYDRDYEGFNRGYNSGYSGLGGANYGNQYSERSRGNYENSGRNYGYGGSNYGGNYYGGSHFGGNTGRNFGGSGDMSNDRSWWDRTKDEVSSWFGDDNAERRRERDRQMNFRGKGPKNYSRSDDRIKEDINDRLSDDSWVDASEIEVTVNSGEVTLTGTVNERNEKRRAEDIAEAVSGVRHVENRLRVGKRDEGGLGSMGSSSSGLGSSASSSGVTGTSSSGTTGSTSKSGTTTSGVAR